MVRDQNEFKIWSVINPSF